MRSTARPASSAVSRARLRGLHQTAKGDIAQEVAPDAAGGLREQAPPVGEGDVGAAGVLSGARPLRLAVAEQEDGTQEDLKAPR